jgi:quinol monooxygenase YgiN
VIAIVWQFEIRQGRSEEFEALYGADGEWTRLSRRSRSFLGSSFLKDVAASDRYLLIEYWSEMVVYERHQSDFTDELKALEQQRDQLVLRVTPGGLFTALDVPDRAGPTWSRRDGR